RFRGMDRDAVTSLAHRVWEGVNLPNLRQHIVRARPTADLVVRKGGGPRGHRDRAALRSVYAQRKRAADLGPPPRRKSDPDRDHHL
ncbi:MAG: hypothetical protein IOB86_03470, partial [Phenylobacterium sp.]